MGAGKLAVGAWESSDLDAGVRESSDLAVGVREVLLLGWRNVVRSGMRERGQSA